MTSPDLQSYIAQARASGQTDEQIRQSLLKTGWQESAIADALGGVINQPGNQSPVPSPLAGTHFFVNVVLTV